MCVENPAHNPAYWCDTNDVPFNARDTTCKNFTNDMLKLSKKAFYSAEEMLTCSVDNLFFVCVV